jgi:hypothetical protein
MALSSGCTRQLTEVGFMLYGLKNVGKDYDQWEIIDRVETTEPVTYSEAEKSLMKILRNWSDISEVVPSVINGKVAP